MREGEGRDEPDGEVEEVVVLGLSTQEGDELKPLSAQEDHNQTTHGRELLHLCLLPERQCK